jgi:hypothetical protein
MTVETKLRYWRKYKRYLEKCIKVVDKTIKNLDKRRFKN